MKKRNCDSKSGKKVILFVVFCLQPDPPNNACLYIKKASKMCDMMYKNPLKRLTQNKLGKLKDLHKLLFV